MTEHTLMEPFDIDGGELDGIPPQIVFCLGFEFCQMITLLESGEPITRTIHTPNASRIKRMCIRRRRKFKVEPCPDVGDQWSFLEVDGMVS